MQAYLAANTTVMEIDTDRLMAHYRAALRTSWRRSIQNITETGRVLKEARDRLPTDQFEALVREEMETDTSMASRLIAIIDGLPRVLANYQKQIPSRIFTLYDLSKLGDDVVEEKVKAGKITPDTTRAQVQKMLPKPKPKPRNKAKRAKRVREPSKDAGITEFQNQDPKPMTARERIYQVLDAWDDELVLELRVPAERREFIRRMTNIAERARELQEHTDGLPGLDAEEETPRSHPLAELEPTGTPDPDSVRPNDRPSVVPVADTRTPDEIIGEMPAWMRRIKPKDAPTNDAAGEAAGGVQPSPPIVPEALQELIDAGVDPDDALEQLQEQANRWN